MKSRVYVKFPKAGLGNMLLTWSRGYVFSELNNLEIYTSSWSTIHWGAVIRREKKKRFYLGYFKEKSYLQKIRFLWSRFLLNEVFEPPVIRIDDSSENSLYVFNKIFTDYDFFKEVRPYKQLVKKGLFQILKTQLQKELNKYEKPEIALHIRRGDFKRGSTLTPLSFFIEVVSGVRKEVGEESPVTIFTDADRDEIRPLLELKRVNIAEAKPDILDILLLASSKVVVLSIGSTFSYWAAFLSEGIIIKHPDEWHVPFRATNDPLRIKEITWDSVSAVPV